VAPSWRRRRPRKFQGLLLATGAIEAACAPLATQNFTDDEIAKFQAIHERLRQYNARGNRKKYYETNLAIHESIVSATRNKFLSELHRSLSLRILRVRFFIEIPESSWDRALGEHEKILEYVETRQGEKLAQLLIEHFKGTWRDCEGTLAQFATPNAASI
jgi:DNA-binding GntR family transcriptional regulator